MWETGETWAERVKNLDIKEFSVAADSDNLEKRREAEREAQGTQGLSKNCTSRERVIPLSRLIRGCRSKYQ